MKKTLLKSAVLAVACVGLMAGSALADPVAGTLDGLNANGDNYQWNDADYWQMTDLASGQGTFSLSWERALNNRDWNFGIYTVTDDGTAIDNTYQIFAAADDPATSMFGTPLTNAAVWISDASGSWGVGATESEAESGVNAFGAEFGFYTEVVSSNTSNGLVFLTDYQLAGTSEEHLFIASDAATHSNIVFFNQGDGAANWEQVVSSNDIDPVPEPATMLLFGTGLAGLAAIGRRKTKKNS